MKKLFLLLAIVGASFIAKADEGMWLLKELNSQSIARMQELGFSFPVDQLYSETNPSLKDAVVIFGGGDRKSTRLNSSHVRISYAVFCLKKKIYQTHISTYRQT